MNRKWETIYIVVSFGHLPDIALSYFPGWKQKRYFFCFTFFPFKFSIFWGLLKKTFPLVNPKCPCSMCCSANFSNNFFIEFNYLIQCISCVKTISVHVIFMSYDWYQYLWVSHAVLENILPSKILIPRNWKNTQNILERSSKRASSENCSCKFVNGGFLFFINSYVTLLFYIESVFLFNKFLLTFFPQIITSPLSNNDPSFEKRFFQYDCRKNHSIKNLLQSYELSLITSF